MAIEYVKVKRNICVGSNPGEKFLAMIKRGQLISEDDLCNKIAESTTLSRGEVKLVIEQLQYNIVKHAKNSHGVKLNDLGIFYPQIRAKAVNTADDVTPDTIINKRLCFRPSVAISKAMKSTVVKGL